MQSLPSPQKVTPLEPGLASQITSALRVKVKGTVSPFKRHMSVSVLGMINNAWNRLSISQPCLPWLPSPGLGQGAALSLAVLWLCWLLPWHQGRCPSSCQVSGACQWHQPWPREILWRADFTRFSVQSFMYPYIMKVAKSRNELKNFGSAQVRTKTLSGCV